MICGNFKYNGRYKKKFKKYYNLIIGYANNKPKNEILDVSGANYWDAISIYDNYIIPKWQRVVTSEKIHKFANETTIRKIINDIQPEFKRSLTLKWRKIFIKSDPEAADFPRNAWQIL